MSFWKKLFGKNSSEKSPSSNLDQQDTVNLEGIIRVLREIVDGAIIGKSGEKLERRRFELVVTNTDQEKEEIFAISPPVEETQDGDGVTAKVVDPAKWSRDSQELYNLDGQTVQLIGWLYTNGDEKGIYLKSYKELIQ